MLDIESNYIDLPVADGTTMRAWFSRPRVSPASVGLMMFQEAFGVNAHIRDVTERFAWQGYAAIAPEVYHRTAPGFEGRYDDSAPAMSHARQLTPQTMETDIRATHAFLTTHTHRNIAAVGYCLGGTMAFLASATVPLTAAVSYYGGRIADNIARAPQLSSPILCFWGGRDKHIGPEIRQTIERGIMKSKHPSIQVMFSDADHGFFCDQRPSYNPQAAQLSWNLTLSFLDQHQGSST